MTSNIAQALFDNELYKSSVLSFAERFGNGRPEEGQTALIERPVKEVASRSMLYGIASAIIGDASEEVFNTVDADIDSAAHALTLLNNILDGGVSPQELLDSLTPPKIPSQADAN